ncbi:hypothetical protein [Croceivirga thetidis]|uniref:Peptidoglycan-binding protein LysM n=1 Tax=Croceivirga thetidis TaxID=2721623 RepID=A0ABX1GV09_9FLAO|nr:hypothetical protein [Croceivirga thetidis]NKI32577.1 hypothetical protein [Croceivirga thetidis]
MKKWISTLLPITTIFVLTSFGPMGFLSNNVEVPEILKTDLDRPTLVVSEEVALEEISDNLVFLGEEFIGFKEELGFKESQGRYDTINKLGYLGKYQFGKSTLKMLGISDADNFLQSPEQQEKAFKLNVARNKWILRRYIKIFSGKIINGTEITESGIIASAHLAGAGNVKKYLRSYGREDTSDVFGSSVGYYMKKFGGFDISSVAQKHNPKF